MNELSKSRRKLAADVRNVLADVDALLDTLQLENAGRLTHARARYDAALRRARIGIARTRAEAKRRTLRAVGDAEVFAHSHPWRIAGFALLAGVALGALLGLLGERERD